MRLADVMSAMQLGTYAEVALVLFMAAFFAVAVNLFLRKNAAAWEQARHLPLDAEPGVSSAPARSGAATLAGPRDPGAAPCQ
jgi:hypothetical protein